MTKHPFDDFINPSWHQKRADNRVVRFGILLVAIVSITTAAAFATTLSSWRSVLKNKESVATKWDDANERVYAYVRIQKELQEAIDGIKLIEQFTDRVPRSLILWELTQALPEKTRLDDVRLETRRRVTEQDGTEITETIMVLGVAPNDSSISSYIDNLTSATCFSDVTLMYAHLGEDGMSRNLSIQLSVKSLKHISMEDAQ
jgi:Tfp pilus assembly protein PilN